jgi:iron complex outermembrane receptor protein
MSLFRSFSIRSLLALSLALSFSTTTFSADDDDADDEIEEVIVTGSRIARAETDGASPIIAITAEDIRASGEMSLAEVLRQSSVNSFGSFQPSSGTTAQSQATISLRGAGAGRTLVLLDGKRMAGSPSYGGVASNINSIPFSAVERVEILTDGGSALYGSDALAGVVNVIMKKDFEGAEAYIYSGNPERGGGEQEAYGFTAGLTSELGNVVISFEHDSREIVYMADRWWSQRNFIDGKDASNATSYFDTLNASFYSCNMWSYASPGFGYEAIPDCVGQSDFLGSGNTYNYGGGGVVLYPYNQIMAEDASTGRDTMFVNYNYDINDNHSVNARGIVTKVNGFGRYAPVAGYFGVECSKWGGCPYTEAQLKAGAGWTDAADGAADWDAVDIYYRMRSVGPRIGKNTDYFTDYLLDFTGDLGFADYSAFLHHSRADYGHMGYNYTLKSVASKLAEDGDFEFANMSDAQAGKLRYTEVSEDDMALSHAGFTLIGDVDTGLPIAGPMDWVVGFEYMSTDYSVLVDAQRASGNVMGSAGSSSSGYRDIRAWFVESRLPITDDIELNLAHRADDYSDFGSANNSKLSLRWQAMDNLVVRASFSESFIAPTLDSLGMSTSFSADSATDRVQAANAGVAARSQQKQVYRLANPDLGPETGEYVNFGIVWNITDDLNLAIDAYELTLENQETLVSANDMLLAEWAGVLDNITSANPTARLVRNNYVAGSSAVDDGTGQCQYGQAQKVACLGSLKEIYAPMANAGGFEVSGFDIALNYSYDTENWGTFRPMLDLTVVDEYLGEDYLGGPLVELQGRNGLPEMRGIFTLAWGKGDWNAYYQYEYVDSMYESSGFDVATLSSTPSGSLDSHATQNIQISYTAVTDTTVTFGIRNLEDEDPVIDSNYSWNSYLYDIYGRTFTLKLEQKF